MFTEGRRPSVSAQFSLHRLRSLVVFLRVCAIVIYGDHRVLLILIIFRCNDIRYPPWNSRNRSSGHDSSLGMSVFLEYRISHCELGFDD